MDKTVTTNISIDWKKTNDTSYTDSRKMIGCPYEFDELGHWNPKTIQNKELLRIFTNRIETNPQNTI